MVTPQWWMEGDFGSNFIGRGKSVAYMAGNMTFKNDL